MTTTRTTTGHTIHTEGTIRPFDRDDVEHAAKAMHDTIHPTRQWENADPDTRKHWLLAATVALDAVYARHDTQDTPR